MAAHGGNYLNANVADVTLTSCNFASGVTAHIFVSWLHPFKEQKLVVVGDRQMAVFDDMQTERKLTLYPHASNGWTANPSQNDPKGRRLNSRARTVAPGVPAFPGVHFHAAERRTRTAIMASGCCAF